MDNNVGSNYPVIVKINENGIVTSVKSRDLNCKTYQKIKTALRKKCKQKVKGFIMNTCFKL